MEPKTQSLLPISTTVPGLQVIIRLLSNHDNSLLTAPLLYDFPSQFLQSVLNAAVKSAPIKL